MSATQKLTKKQKKGLAFRDRKTGKGPKSSTSAADNELDEMEAMAIPIMEDQDLADNDGDTTQTGRDEDKKRGKGGDHGARSDAKPRKSADVGKAKRKSEKEDVQVAVEVGKESGAGKGKKRKRESGEDAEGAEGGEVEGTSKAKTPKKAKTSKNEDAEAKGKSRYILFVGNLPYRITKESIAEHFAKCDPPPSVRLLTPKVRPGVQATKSKGCAFLEFTHKNAMQQGLKLHQTTLGGRMINVELTAGGGGKGQDRLQKVKERNQALLKEREERLEKDTKDGKSFPNLPSKPQRFSTTSGLDHVPVQDKTWTVGDVDDGQTHRGKRGKRPSKSQTSAKTWGTGVNAIPVG